MVGPGIAGTLGNEWHHAHSWPKTELQRWYLTSPDPERSSPSKWEMPGPRSGALILGRPGNGEASLIYDPSNPYGTYGGNNLFVQPCGPQDQVLPQVQFSRLQFAEILIVIGTSSKH